MTFKAEDGKDVRPVIIHRAILGSVERFMAILIENTASLGAPQWPFWLSPRPVMIVPVAPTYIEYAEKVKQQLFDAGVDAEIDDSLRLKFQKKIAVGSIFDCRFLSSVLLTASPNFWIQLHPCCW